MKKTNVSIFQKFVVVGKFLISQNKSLFLILFFLSIISAILGIFVPQVIGAMTNAFQGNSITDSFPFYWFKTPLSITILFVVCGVLKIATSFTASVVDRAFQNNLTQALKSYLHDKIISLDAEYHQQHDQGENLFNVNNAIGVVSTASMLFVLPVSSIIALYLAIVSLYSSLSTAAIPLWLILCIIPAIFAQPFIGYWLGNLINDAFGKLRSNNMVVNEELLNSFKSPLEIQVMVAEKQRSASLLQALKNVTRSSNRANTFAILDNQFTSICVLFFQALIAFVVVIYYFKTDNIDTKVAGSLVTCIMLIPEVFNQIGAFIATYIQTKQSEPEFSAVFEIMMAESTINDDSNAIVYAGKQAKEILVENLQFGYNEKMILQGVTANIPPGKAVAIVSHSGGGKSTLLHLFSRLYDPQTGYISIDGQNIKRYTISSLRSAIIRVSQFPLFIQGSLRENFQLQKADATDNEIEETCRKVGVWDVIKEQHNGARPADLLLPLGAENFSGGQRRLLAIARAMLKDPAVLLLDEPTTGVDAQTTQDKIYPFLMEYKKKCSIIFVDHNMNFVRNLADMVLVLEDGKVADFGPTEEVWQKKDSLFRKLWEEYNKNTEFSNELDN